MNANGFIGSAFALSALLLTACGGSDSSEPAPVEQPETATPAPTPTPEPAPTPSSGEPFQELYDQGVDRYLGKFSPAFFEESDSGGTLHYFDVDLEEGPMCFTGNQYYMATRDGTVDELMIFVEGGGVCGEENCEAIEFPFPGGVPTRGIMNPADADNAAANFDMAYIPYCDGSFHTGDSSADSDGDGSDDRFFRGLHNLSAALDVIVTTYPAPTKIVLAGNSAGGFGTHFALPLVRKLYPTIPIELINDSGVGVMPDGLMVSLLEYWGAESALPASCSDCIDQDGNLTQYQSYQLAQDDNIRMALLSYRQDESATSGPNLSPEAYEAQLLAAVAALEREHADRFRSLIANGDSHTFVQRDFKREVGNTTVNEWLNEMINQADNWLTVIEQ